MVCKHKILVVFYKEENNRYYTSHGTCIICYKNIVMCCEPQEHIIKSCYFDKEINGWILNDSLKNEL